MDVLKERVLKVPGHNSKARDANFQPGDRSIGKLALCCALLSLWLGASIARAQGSAEEYQIKAAFLFHFAQLVDWPSDANETTGTSVNLCMFENESHRQEILNSIDGKPIGGRTFHVRMLHPLQDAHGCNLLFMSNDNARRELAILNNLRGLPILTVGEDDEFLADGGMIRFRLDGDHIRFDINLAAAESSGLRISSRLLLLATHVQRAVADARGGR